jgi:hypothetical protein
VVTARSSSPVPAVVGVLLGLAVGALTSVLQASLDFPWLALVNAVSPWLTTAFVVGALQPRLRAAVVVGLLATAMQVVGYYVTAELRDFDASMTYVVLWSACAVVGGPLFGAAGWSWRRARPAGLGAAAIVDAYASEALVAYQLRLGYTSSAVLFGAIALVLAVGLGRHRGQYRALARWVVPVFLAGVAGHWLIGLLA